MNNNFDNLYVEGISNVKKNYYYVSENGKTSL